MLKSASSTAAQALFDSDGNYSKPPALHWALVLLLHFATLGIFGLVWIYRQAAWVRRIDPTNEAVYVLVGAFLVPPATALFLIPFSLSANELLLRAAVLLARLVFFAGFVWSYFSMRASIEDRFNLKLSGIMTFFFHVLYLQYHMTRIAKGQYIPHQNSLLQ